MSDSAEDYEIGWESGYKSGVRETTRILTDLIAELREHVDGLDGDLVRGYQNFFDAQREARDITNRAEARLKGLNDEL